MSLLVLNSLRLPEHFSGSNLQIRVLVPHVLPFFMSGKTSSLSGDVARWRPSIDVLTHCTKVYGLRN